MTSLAEKLSDIVGGAFEVLGLPREIGAVRVSDRPDLCQFQCNGAMAAAKIAKKNPREVAQGVVEALADRPELAKVEIAGPGFINLNITDNYLAAHLMTLAADVRFGVAEVGVGRTAILDYGGMNVAKAMHVGHLRSLAIGDCLKRLMRFVGYEALGDIHLGDWGLQMGQIISEFEIRYPEWPYFDAEYAGEYPDAAPFEYAELEEVYPAASQACKEYEERLELARRATAELQNGRRGYVALWRHFIALSIADIKENIEPLGIDFEIWKGESDVNDLIPDMHDALLAKGVVEESKGAQIITVARGDDKQEMPPLLFLKSDGAATYGTTDLATIYDRVQAYSNLTHVVYETDIRQKLHFEQVFRAADRAGYVSDVTLKHIGHGTINGTDGKPFKTREGKAMTFRDMVEACLDKATSRLGEANLADDLTAEERGDIALKVTCAALKFAELSNQAHMDYIFDLDRMTSFEGKTGPYVLYQAVRIQSLLKKAEYEEATVDGCDLVSGDADRALTLLLCELPDHFETALTNYAPYVLCDYAYRLAQEFSSFYGNCHILSEEDADVRGARLRLCALTHRQLCMIVNVLGIAIPARM